MDNKNRKNNGRQNRRPQRDGRRHSSLQTRSDSNDSGRSLSTVVAHAFPANAVCVCGRPMTRHYNSKGQYTGHPKVRGRRPEMKPLVSIDPSGQAIIITPINLPMSGRALINTVAASFPSKSASSNNNVKKSAGTSTRGRAAGVYVWTGREPKEAFTGKMGIVYKVAKRAGEKGITVRDTMAKTGLKYGTVTSAFYQMGAGAAENGMPRYFKHTEKEDAAAPAPKKVAKAAKVAKAKVAKRKAAPKPAAKAASGDSMAPRLVRTKRAAAHIPPAAAEAPQAQANA
jgi:hypothetical protein